MNVLVPWKTSPQITLHSHRSSDQIMERIRESIDFEGNVTPIDHFVSGDKPFIGRRDVAKNSFLICHRHGNGLAFMSRCAIGRVSKEGSGSTVSYEFTMRPWDRLFLSIWLLMMLLFNGLAVFSVVMKPTGEYLALLGITSGLLVASWLTPTFCQWYFRHYESEIAKLLSEIAAGR